MRDSEKRPVDGHHEEEFLEGVEEAPPGVKTAGLVRWAMLAVALLGAGFTLAMAVGVVGSHAHAADLYHCPMHPTVVQEGPGDCPICGMDLVPVGEGGDADAHHGHHHAEGDDAIAAAAKELGAKPGQWICPMTEDGIVSDQPGECPKCGMDLVQVPEDPLAAAAKELGAKPGQWICPMTECGTVSDHPGECPVCGMNLQQVPEGEEAHAHVGPAIYSCPMHPEVEQEGPGKCPKCGMYLERKGEKKAEPLPVTAVTIPAERLAKIGVRTAKVEPGKLNEQVRTVGVVAADERKRHVVQTRYSGWIEELLVDETGAKVRKGQPLARIYSPELYQAQVEYINAVQWGGDLARPAEQRLRLLGIADADLAALRKRKEPQRTMTLRAPASGHVLHKGAVAGSYVAPGTIVFEIADLSRVWVLADVYEQDVRRVKVGTKATFAANAVASERFVGEVSFVYPTVEPSTRTMKVRLEIDNDEIRLRPGMFGDVRLEAPAPEGLVVPRDGVIESGDHVYAFVAKGGGRFEPREVHILGRSGDHVLVEGLEPGDEVVTSAGFFIDSESRLRAALSGMAH